MKNKFSAFDSQKKGFVLVELMVGLFIFSMIISTLYSILLLSNVLMRTHEVRARISSDGLQVLRTINRELCQTSYTTDRLVISTDGNGNSVVRFQIPVDYDNDGDVVTSNLTKSIEWGAYDNNGDVQKGTGQSPLNRWARYSVSNGQLVRDVLDATLTAVGGLTKVISNDVQSFTATQNSKTISLNITLSVSDQVGQSGMQRTLQGTFTYSTYLRNVPT